MLEHDCLRASSGRMMEVVKLKSPRELTPPPPPQQQLGAQETITYSAVLSRVLAADRSIFCEHVTWVLSLSSPWPCTQTKCALAMLLCAVPARVCAFPIEFTAECPRYWACSLNLTTLTYIQRSSYYLSCQKALRHT